jgi:FMN phosphatase YigB (HAD superfamily)
VLFDLHSTVLDQGDSTVWMSAAASHVDARHRVLLADPILRHGLDHIWDDAKDVDPDSLRDRDPVAHRRVFGALMARMPIDVPPQVVDALYETQFTAWRAYADAASTLRAVKALGVKTAALSNISHDVRPVLAREGLLAHLDTVVLSFQVDAVKPDPAIYRYTLDALGGVEPASALMVGDSWVADSGGAAIGIRTLLLPRTLGPMHGLSAVTALVKGTLGR